MGGPEPGPGARETISGFAEARENPATPSSSPFAMTIILTVGLHCEYHDRGETRPQYTGSLRSPDQFDQFGGSDRSDRSTDCTLHTALTVPGG